MEKVFEIYIKTTPERLWEAITNPEMRRKYNFGVGVESEWTPGSRYRGVSPLAPAAICEGENFEVDRPHRLVQSFRALWSDDVKREGNVADHCLSTVPLCGVTISGQTQTGTCCKSFHGPCSCVPLGFDCACF